MSIISMFAAALLTAGEPAAATATPDNHAETRTQLLLQRREKEADTAAIFARQAERDELKQQQIRAEQAEEKRAYDRHRELQSQSDKSERERLEKHVQESHGSLHSRLASGSGKLERIQAEALEEKEFARRETEAKRIAVSERLRSERQQLAMMVAGAVTGNPAMVAGAMKTGSGTEGSKTMPLAVAPDSGSPAGKSEAAVLANYAKNDTGIVGTTRGAVVYDQPIGPLPAESCQPIVRPTAWWKVDDSKVLSLFGHGDESCCGSRRECQHLNPLCFAKGSQQDVCRQHDLDLVGHSAWDEGNRHVYEAHQRGSAESTSLPVRVGLGFMKTWTATPSTLETWKATGLPLFTAPKPEPGI